MLHYRSARRLVSGGVALEAFIMRDKEYKPGTVGMIGLNGRFIPASDNPAPMRTESVIRVLFCAVMGLISLAFILVPCWFLPPGHGWTTAVSLVGGAFGLSAALTGFFGN